MCYVLYRDMVGASVSRAAVMTTSDAEHWLVPNLAGPEGNLRSHYVGI